MRYLIIVAEFNEIITKSLLEGAKQELTGAGIDERDIDVVWVPGCFEIPGVAATAARRGTYDSIITLGAVIRGETSHYDFVAGQTASGLMTVSVETGVPIIFGILTTDTVEQAFNRAGIKGGNKGRDCAHCALKMTKVMKQLEETQSK